MSGYPITSEREDGIKRAQTAEYPKAIGVRGFEVRKLDHDSSGLVGQDAGVAISSDNFKRKLEKRKELEDGRRCVMTFDGKYLATKPF